MSYTSVGSTDCLFLTQEQGMVFTVRVNEEVSAANVAEVKRRGERMPYDLVVLRSGVEIKDSLSARQKQVVLERIEDLTQKNDRFCEEYDVIWLSRHILSDYLNESPKVLTQRGWSCEYFGLKGEITRTVINTFRVEKAKMLFNEDGMGRSPLSYTILGEDQGVIRKVSILFTGPPVVSRRSIMAVTVLRTN